MANRFWVGGGSSTNWNAVGPTNWAATSGGAGNQSVPGAGDAVFFDANGNSNSTLSASQSILTLSIAVGYTATLTHNAAVLLTVAGTSFSMGSACTYTLGNAASSAITFTNNTGAITFTANGKTFGDVSINVGTARTVTLQDNLTCNVFTLTQGTFDTNGKSITSISFDASGAGTKALTFTSGTWTVTTNNATVINWNATGSTTTIGGTWASNYAGSTGTRTFTLSTVSIGSLNITGGSDTVTITGNAGVTSGNVTNLTFSGGFNGTLSNNAFSIGGNITLSAAMSLTAGANALTFVSNAATVTIFMAGLLTDFPITFNSLGAGTGVFTLTSPLTLGSTRTLTHTKGNFVVNNNAVATGLFVSSNANTRTINMGTSTFALTGTGTVWNTGTTTGLTFTAQTSTVVVSDTSATGKTFTTGNVTFYNVNFAGDNVTVSDSPTISNVLRIDTAGLTNGLKFTSGQTVTIGSSGDVRTNGASGSLAKLVSTTAGSAATITKDSGQVCLNYMSLKDSAAAGTTKWKAGKDSTDVSGNSGWSFTSCPTPSNPPVNQKKQIKKIPINTTISGVAAKRGALYGRFNIYTLVSQFISRFFHMFR